MAISYIENAVAINNYHGVTVYHVHKDDLAEQPVRECFFTLDPYGSEVGEETFDIREWKGYDAVVSAQTNLTRAIDDGWIDEEAHDDDLIAREGEEGGTMYDGYEEKAGVCPICFSDELDYPVGFEDVDDSRSYNFTCPRCGATGKEWHRLQFDGFEVD